MVHVCSSARRHFGGKFGISGAEEQEKAKGEERGRRRKGKWRKKRRSFLRENFDTNTDRRLRRERDEECVPVRDKAVRARRESQSLQPDFERKLIRVRSVAVLGPDFGRSRRVTSTSVSASRRCARRDVEPRSRERARRSTDSLARSDPRRSGRSVPDADFVCSPRRNLCRRGGIFLWRDLERSQRARTGTNSRPKPPCVGRTQGRVRSEPSRARPNHACQEEG